MSRTKHSGKAINAADKPLQKRDGASFGTLATRPHFVMVRRFERYAQMRFWKATDAPRFEAAGGDRALEVLRAWCQRDAVALVMGAIRPAFIRREDGKTVVQSSEHGEVIFDPSGLSDFLKAVEGLNDRRGPVHRLHREILDLLTGADLSIDELMQSLGKRMNHPDTENNRRTVRANVAKLGLSLRASPRGRPSSRK